MHEALAVIGLVAMLAVALRRPTWLPEVAVAVPVVAILVAAGSISGHDAWHEIGLLGPVVGFLAAVLVLAECCDAEGLFAAAGSRLFGRSSSAARLLVAVVVLSAVTTAVLSLDTTVVLLTPVVVAGVRARGVMPRPHLYATAHLANSASLLLPVSNLTNLLAVAEVHVSFPRFAALMALPWLIAVAVELAGLRSVFGRDLVTTPRPEPAAVTPVPRVATVILTLTVIGFALQPVTHLAPVWVATAGAGVLAVYRLARRRATGVEVARATAPSFCLFVLGLGVVVRAVSDDGLGRVVRDVMPSGVGLVPLLTVTVVAAVLANLVNNLPATLLLLPVAATAGLGQVLAVLVGVNLGPNLTYTGSLATLLWRRVVHDVPDVPALRDFTVLGLVTVPVGVVLATVAVWVSVRVIGAG